LLIRRAIPVWDLYNRYNVGNIYIDGSAPGLIQSLKAMLNDDNDHSDYLNTHIPQNRWPFIMKVVPVNFREEGREILERTRIFMDKGWIVIHSKHRVNTAIAYSKNKRKIVVV
jgi:hypothetical protein